MSQITRRLEELRKKKKISQTELAEAIGMTQTGLSQALRKGDFKTSVLKKIASFLEVPVSYFFETGSVGISGQVLVDNGNNQSINYADHCKGLLAENKLLKEKIKGLTNEVNLLKEMVEMFKQFGVTQSFDFKTGKKLFHSGGKFFDPDNLEK